ncbi:hypothetical protein [Roseateles sp.]|jgi:hypothetical protein|uniref:hypothetical protein n=1 Tax=Roseateles sp. TaxID=1971397 RepID=UPI0037CA1CB7
MARFWLKFTAGLLCLVVALELAFRLLPVSTATLTGYYIDADLLTYPPGHSWKVATGWDLRNAQRLQANSHGFASHREFESNPNAVALIGDSYVEASMLAAQDRPGAQLERQLGGRAVFPLGTPGTALLDYAQRIRYASERFGVKDFVVLMEAGDARQSLCGSGNVVSRCLDAKTLQATVERQAAPSTAKRWLRHSALAQYINSQLKFRPEAFWRSVWTRQTPELQAAKPDDLDRATVRQADVERSRQVIDAVLDRFFSEIAPYAKGRLVIAVDGSRGVEPTPPSDGQFERAYLIASLRERGATVVDLESIFRKHALASGRSLEVGPYDAHLNAIGVGLAMQASTSALLHP